VAGDVRIAVDRPRPLRLRFRHREHEGGVGRGVDLRIDDRAEEVEESRRDLAAGWRVVGIAGGSRPVLVPWFHFGPILGA